MLTLSDRFTPAAERAMAFAKDALGASRSAFYRVGDDLNLDGFVLDGVPFDFYAQYVGGMGRCDPLHARYARDRSVARLGAEFAPPASPEVATFQSLCAHFGIDESVEFFFRSNGRIFAGLNLAWVDARPVPEGAMVLAQKIHDYIEFNLSGYLKPETDFGGSTRYHLSQRERDVLDLLCCGRTNNEIGDCLGIGTSTVKTHLKHIFEKLGVETRAAAVALVLK